jgi:hypothetical protein
MSSSTKYEWIRGSRGGFKGDWRYLAPERNARIQLLEVDVSSREERGLLRPWDWCLDVVEFDQDHPWRIHIPAEHRGSYELQGDIHCWIFPNLASNSNNFRRLNSGKFIANPNIIASARRITQQLSGFVTILVARTHWKLSYPTDVPDIENLLIEWDSAEEALACVWRVRRPILDALAFVAHFLVAYNGRGCKSWEASSMWTDFDWLRAFMKNNIFSGQRPRGTVVTLRKLHSFYAAHPDICTEIFAPLISNSPTYPFPFAVLLDYSGDDAVFKSLFDFSKIRATRVQQTVTKNFLLPSINDSHGWLVTGRDISRCHSQLKSVVYASEIDRTNNRFFFFNKPKYEPDPDDESDEEQYDDPLDLEDFDKPKTNLTDLLVFDCGQKRVIDDPVKPNNKKRKKKSPWVVRPMPNQIGQSSSRDTNGDTAGGEPPSRRLPYHHPNPGQSVRQSDGRDREQRSQGFVRTRVPPPSFPFRPDSLPSASRNSVEPKPALLLPPMNLFPTGASSTTHGIGPLPVVSGSSASLQDKLVERSPVHTSLPEVILPTIPSPPLVVPHQPPSSKPPPVTVSTALPAGPVSPPLPPVTTLPSPSDSQPSSKRSFKEMSGLSEHTDDSSSGKRSAFSRDSDDEMEDGQLTTDIKEVTLLRERSFIPCLDWRGNSSPFQQLGIQVDPSNCLDRINMSKKDIDNFFQSCSIQYSQGIFSAWLAETGIIVPLYGPPSPLASLAGATVNVDFLRSLHVTLPWKTEMVLLSYVEQFPDATGPELFGFCLTNGLPIFVYWRTDDGRRWADRHRMNNGQCNVHHEVLSHRFIPNVLPTAAICRDWLQRVTYLFHRPEGQRFVFYGGYVSRLVIELMGPGYLVQACDGPSHQYLAHAQRRMHTTNEWDLWDSEVAFESSDDEILRDIYGFIDSTRSLWPPLHIFFDSDRWTGIWSQQNEAWFKSMMNMIRRGQLPSHTWGEKSAGKKSSVGINNSGPIERKVIKLRREGKSLLKLWRSNGIASLSGTPLETSGLLIMSESTLLYVTIRSQKLTSSSQPDFCRFRAFEIMSPVFSNCSACSISL